MTDWETYAQFLRCTMLSMPKDNHDNGGPSAIGAHGIPCGISAIAIPQFQRPSIDFRPAQGLELRLGAQSECVKPSALGHPASPPQTLCRPGRAKAPGLGLGLGVWLSLGLGLGLAVALSEGGGGSVLNVMSLVWLIHSPGMAVPGLWGQLTYHAGSVLSDPSPLPSLQWRGDHGEAPKWGRGLHPRRIWQHHPVPFQDTRPPCLGDLCEGGPPDTRLK
jgi:hypothetical protein